MRVCFDTNVLVAAVATRGLAADVLRLTLAEHDLLVPDVVLVELRRVLRTKFKLRPARIAELEAFLREHEVVPNQLRCSRSRCATRPMPGSLRVSSRAMRMY